MAPPTFTPSGINYDYALAGQPFLSAAGDERPVQRALAEVQKQRVDQAAQPGEQSLAGWWIRSQTDWSGGAGQEFMEPADDPLVMRSFYESTGINPWTPGSLTALRAPYAARSVAGGTVNGALWSGTYLYVWEGSTTNLCTLATNGTISATNAVTGAAGTINQIAFGGGKAVAYSTNGKLYTRDAGASSATGWVEAWNTASTEARGNNVAGWAKQRWFISKANVLYMASHPTAPPKDVTTETAVYTHPNADFRWNAVCEAPGAVLASGYAVETGSVIYKFTVTDTAGVTTFSSGSNVAELPRGEKILAMESYLGAFLILVTTRGVRVGVLNDTGTVQYGPLSYESAYCSGSIAKFDSFAWVPVSRVGSFVGSVRLNLGDVGDDLRVPWATDVRSTGTYSDGYEKAWSITVRDADTVYLSTTLDAGAYHVLIGPHATNWWTSPTLTSGWIRYGTQDDKMVHSMRVRSSTGPTIGRVLAYVSNADGGVLGGGVSSLISGYTLVTDTDTIHPVSPAYKVQLSFITNATGNPVCDFWQLRALPAVPRQELIRQQFLCFDYERDQHGNQTGYEGSALARWEALRDLIDSGVPQYFQDLNTGETRSVLVDDISFSQVAPPAAASGFGGTIAVTMRAL